MPDTFKIGLASSGGTFKTLEEWLVTTDIPVEPDHSHQPFATSLTLGNGTERGQGYGIVKWRWQHMDLANRYILRNTFCPYPALTAENIYIHTPVANTDSTGALVWATFQTILHWPNVDVDFQVDQELGLLLTFTHLVLIP